MCMKRALNKGVPTLVALFIGMIIAKVRANLSE